MASTTRQHELASLSCSGAVLPLRSSLLSRHAGNLGNGGKASKNVERYHLFSNLPTCIILLVKQQCTHFGFSSLAYDRHVKQSAAIK